MKPLESLNALPNQEFMKGEIAMAEFAIKLPSIMLEAIDIELKELEDETA